MALIDDETRAEKLRPPRALTAIGASLWAEPAIDSQTAWLAWWSGSPEELREIVAQARLRQARRLMVGGPPGNYVESGVDADDHARLAALAAAGFVARDRYVDLRVRTDVTPRPAVDGSIVRATNDLADPVRTEFGAGWAWECSRAQSHGGLFAAHSDEGALLGVAAHSGNLVHRGTFGPIGVLPAARGRGVGAALATVVLADLHARGFVEATVPWVEFATVPFYAGLATITARVERVALALDLARRGSSRSGRKQ